MRYCYCSSGYGNIAPQTFWGRLVCISYALVGIPIMLLCLANLGELMANIFRFTYSKVCCCGCCRCCNKRSKNTSSHYCWLYLLPPKKEVKVFARVCLFVCLSVSLLARLLKNACMDLDEMLRVDWDVGTWTNWLTFEPDSDPDYSPDAGTGLLSPILYKRCYAEFYIGKIPRIRISGAPLQWGVVLKWFYSLSRGNTFVSTECPSSFLFYFTSPWNGV